MYLILQTKYCRCWLSKILSDLKNAVGFDHLEAGQKHITLLIYLIQMSALSCALVSNFMFFH